MTEYVINNGNEELIAIAKNYPDDVLLLDFHAVWCGPCKAIAPKIHDLVKKYAQSDRRLILCKVDVDQQDDLSSMYNITSMPTFIWVEKGQIKHRVEGANLAKITKTTESMLN